jgi:hypothetical protein
MLTEIPAGYAFWALALLLALWPSKGENQLVKTQKT